MQQQTPSPGPLASRRDRTQTPYEPPVRPWKGAAIGMALAAYTLVAFAATQLDTPLGTAADLLLSLLAGALLAVITAGAGRLLLALPRRIDLRWGAWLLAALMVAVVYIAVAQDSFTMFLVPVLLLPPALLGSAVGLGLERGFGRPLPAMLLILAVLLNGSVACWWLWSGPRGSLPAPGAAGNRMEPIRSANPAEPGGYTVKTLTYGTGTDRRRQEFREPAIVTEPVDATRLLPNWSGSQGWYREWYWQITPARLPVNGRVWYPSGEGPFPLVLVVHGNHQMSEFSDPGYAYLGELLASRGYIAVSVDENFLNLSWAGDMKGKENTARAWLLLKHLEFWQKLNGTVGTPFYRRVDMGNIALVGHSRGGEAAYLAGVLNELPYLPDDATVPLGFRFNIRAVAALAPTDGMSRPGDRLAPLENVSYLVLQGAADADVTSYPGLRSYNRVAFTDGQEGFRAGLLIHGANHGQFNTVWGGKDWSGLSNQLLSPRALMEGEAQRQVARVYLSAFLDITLRGRDEYLPLMQDWRTGAQWLPRALYASQYAGARFRVVSDYQEDLNVLTTTVSGGLAAGENLSAWREGAISPALSGHQGAVRLAWPQTGGKPAAYTLALPDNLTREWQLGGGWGLTFTVADARDPGAERPLDFSVELLTQGGIGARLALSQWAPVPAAVPLPVLTKLGPLEQSILKTRAVPVFQTYVLPLSAFTEGTAFRPEELRTIRFRFDRSESGAIWLDDVGFAPLPSR